jgi:hypothetical protein
MFLVTELVLLTEYEELIDISTDLGLRETHTNIPLINFWASLKEQFPRVSSVTVKKLLLFTCTYLCEAAFSRYEATRTKYRNRLNSELDMRIQLFTIVPDFNSLEASKQIHPSH